MCVMCIEPIGVVRCIVRDDQPVFPPAQRKKCSERRRRRGTRNTRTYEITKWGVTNEQACTWVTRGVRVNGSTERLGTTTSNVLLVVATRAETESASGKRIRTRLSMARNGRPTVALLSSSRRLLHAVHAPSFGSSVLATIPHTRTALANRIALPLQRTATPISWRPIVFKCACRASCKLVWTMYVCTLKIGIWLIGIKRVWIDSSWLVKLQFSIIELCKARIGLCIENWHLANRDKEISSSFFSHWNFKF